MSHYITCGRCGGTITGDSGQCSDGDGRCECRHELTELTFEAGKTDGYHPNLDGPAEPVGLQMSDEPFWKRECELAEQRLDRLRTLIETDVLPVLSDGARLGCIYHPQTCGECYYCHAAKVAEQLRKELSK